MALLLLRRSFSTLKNSSALLTAQPLTNHIPVTSKLLFETKPTIHARYSSERPRLGLRRQNLPPYPTIDCVRALEISTFLPSHYKQVQIGDYNFMESEDGFVVGCIHAYKSLRDSSSIAGFSVYFGENHPLNLSGGVERRQHTNHAKMYAFCKLINQIPENLIKKLCIFVDELTFISFTDKGLRYMSENSFRSGVSGKLNKDLETSMEMNRLLRVRQDFALRLKFVPNDVGNDFMYQAQKIAVKAAERATRQYREEHFKKMDEV